MNLVTFLEKLKPKHIIAASAAYVSLNLILNISLSGSDVPEIYNAAFSVAFSAFIATTLFGMYYVSRKEGFIFSKTLIWMALSMSAWAVGDAVYFYFVAIHADPFISPSDIFYIAGSLLQIMVILTIPSSQPASHRRNMVFIEISILILSATVLFTILQLARAKPDLSFDAFTLLMVFVYPVLDVILIWIVTIIYFTYPVKSSQKVLELLFVGVIFIFGSDLYYLFSSIYGSISREYIVDIGYYVFYTMILLAGVTGFKQIRYGVPDTEKKVTAFKSGNWIVFIPGIFLSIVIGFVLLFVVNHSIVFSYGIILLIAFTIILFILHQYMVITDNIKLTKEMRRVNAQLEEKVELRTAELSKANAELHEEMKERERAEMHLARSNQDLALLNRDKDKLFSILAHDLRSPLGSMMNLSEILMENMKDFDENELLDIVGTLRKSASHTFQLFNDLLAWSAVQMGRGEREKEIFQVSEVVAENVMVLSAEIERKQIVVQSDMDNEIVAYADKFAIQTVLRNLISNAVKFTHQAGTVTISAEKQVKFVKISVTDTGVGMSREKQRKIFKVDAVSSSPGTEGEKGSGFGLLLCKDLIERNNGEIWLESEKGQGSAFHFTLPYLEKSSKATEKIPAARIHYTYDKAARITFNTMIGEINPSVLRSELSLMWSSSDYNADYSVLVDLREASLVIDTNDIPAVLEIFSAMPGNKKNRKFALLTATPQQVAFSTMFGQNIKNKYPFIVEVFSTYEAALNWLGV